MSLVQKLFSYVVFRGFIVAHKTFRQTPNLELQASRAFAFYFQKTRCANILSVLPFRVKCQEIFILGCFNRVIFKGFLFCIFFLHCELSKNIIKSHAKCCHKIVHITFQRKRNYVVSMILQIRVQSRTRTASIM